MLPFLFKLMEIIDKTTSDLNKAILAFCLVEAAWQKRLNELSDCFEYSVKPYFDGFQDLAFQRKQTKYELDVVFEHFINADKTWHSYSNLIELCCEVGLSAVTDKQEIVSLVPPPYMGDYLLGKTDTLSTLLSNYIEFASDPYKRRSSQFQKKLMEYQNSFSYFMKAVFDKRYDKRMEF